MAIIIAILKKKYVIVGEWGRRALDHRPIKGVKLIFKKYLLNYY